MSKLRLAVGIPAYGGQITAHQARMWMEFGNTLGGSSERFTLVAFDFYDVNGIDQARNQMLTRAVEVGADWLLMIDADTWVEPGRADREAQTDAGFLLLRMISEADRAGAEVVVAPVVRRTTADTAERELAVYRYDEAQQGSTPHPYTCKCKACTFHIAAPVVLDELPYGLVEIDSAGAAVFAVRVMSVFDKRISFAFRSPFSEDREFCRQVRESGGKILVDTRVRTGHLSRSFPLFTTKE